jgi:hypothetical protein
MLRNFYNLFGHHERGGIGHGQLYVHHRWALPSALARGF